MPEVSVRFTGELADAWNRMFATVLLLVREEGHKMPNLLDDLEEAIMDARSRMDSRPPVPEPGMVGRRGH